MTVRNRFRYLVYYISVLLPQLLIIASYSNIIYAPPIFDDYHSFVYQQKISTGMASFHNVLALSDTVFGWSRWVPMLTFAFDYKIGGGNIAYFHITNIIIHCFATFAVIFLLFQLLIASGRYELNNHVDFICISVWVASIWSLSPVHTGAVTYIVQRMASIQALFYILSVAFYVRGRLVHNRHQRLDKAFSLYLISLIAGILSFLSKQNSATLPITLFLTELWFFQPNLLASAWSQYRRSKWAIKLTVLIVLLAAMGFVVYVFSIIILPGYGIRRFTLGERLMTEARIVVWYASLLLWPAPSRLSLEHDVLISTSLWSPPTTICSIILIGCVLYSIVRYRRRYPLVTYAGMWFFITLSIESTVVPLELVFEHRLYLPSVGFYTVVVMFFDWIYRTANSYLTKCEVRELRVAMWCIFAVLSSVLAMTTFARNETWRDALAMARDSALKAPENPRAHANYAVSLCRTGKLDEAIEEAKTALQLGKECQEQYAVSANVIVSSLMEKGEIAEAIRYGEKLFDNRPARIDIGAMPPFCSNMAEGYHALGQFEAAYSWTLKGMNYALGLGSANDVDLLVDMQAKILSAVEGKNVDLDGDGAPDPDQMSVYAWIGRKFLSIGNVAEAQKLASLSLSENPEDADAKAILHIVSDQERQNRLQGNNWDFSKRYLTLPISRLNIYLYIAHLLCEEERSVMLRSLGEHCVDLALKFNPQSPDAHLLKGWYYYERSEFDKAVEEAKYSANLDPEYARAWLGLGFFLLRVHKEGAATVAFQKTLELYPGYPRRAAIQNIITSLQQEAKPS